jgi:hypothetical protein
VLALAAERVSQLRFNLVVISDDTALRLLRDWKGLSSEQRLLLAPVASATDLDQLTSKVTAGVRLESAGVPVPRWREARGLAEAWLQLQLAHARADASLPPDVGRHMRVLVEECVPRHGPDLFAFFRRSELDHATLPRFTETLTKRGANSERHYLPTYGARPGVVQELTAIGDALGLNGFANITACDAPGGLQANPHRS